MAIADNEQQAAYWNEDAGPRWVAYQERLDRQIEGPGLAAMDASGVSQGENVLDVGCGCGGSSLELARRVGPTGSVLGVDVSGPMLARARERAADAGLANLTFEQCDAQTYRFETNHFDLMFSRFGVMFFADPVAAFANIGRAIRPGGRLCFLSWRPVQENPWILVPMMAAAQHVELPPPPPPGEPGPFAFGDADRVRTILTEAGFEDVSIEPFDTSEAYGESVDDTLEFLQQIGPLSRILANVDDLQRGAVLNAVRDALVPHAGADGISLARAMWIVKAANPG